ncbi:MAG: PfkB family carbohydrate kinase [Planctomycetota bacterium]|jgi:D-beta-D-heptose 7-phosphate kinase/D-beta-D-heptose 1-phosphate adenosyltransferase|nr:PfkB family carbohydrate kinase [Planctomycetota bacterium]
MAGWAAGLLERAAGARIICLGDVMLDRYIRGGASRISPEAPVPVVHVSRRASTPGGAGNVAKNLADLGLHPVLGGVVGDDADAGELDRLFLGNAAYDGFFLLRDHTRPTTVKTRVVAGIQQVVRFDDEDASPLSAGLNKRLLAKVAELLPSARALALSDYAKGVVNPDLAREAIRLAVAAGVPVAVDPKGRDYAKYSGADLVKPNHRELVEAAGSEVRGDLEAAAAGRSLMDRHGIKNLLITLGDRGMLLLRGGVPAPEPILFPSLAREVFDVTGAGDTVLAALVAALAAGASLEEGARLATLAAGLVVGKVGAATVSVSELERASRD